MSDIEEIVEQAKAPGVFSIVDAVRGRNYPTDTVDVFIDEDVAFSVSELNEEIAKIAKKLDVKTINKKDIDELMSRQESILNERDKLIQEMGGTKYVFHMTGIPEGKRQDIYDSALKKFPMQYENNRNSFTGDTEKVEVESVERDRYFTALLWQACIAKVVAPDGSVQEGITDADALELRRILPLAAITTITEAIERMRAATALFMLSVNEDFLAKS